MKVVYIAGPYKAPSFGLVNLNIARARLVAEDLAGLGIGFFCPHLHTAHMEALGLPEKFFKDLDLEILSHCDAIFMMNDWEVSEGASKEKAFMEDQGGPVFFSFAEVIRWKEELEEKGEW